MKKIIDFFKNRIVMSLLGLLLLSLLIWFAGPSIKFGEENTAPLASVISRLIAMIVLLVIWGLNNLRVQLQNKKHNEDLVNDLQENQKAIQQDPAVGQAAEELQQINQRFSQALSTLKKLKFKGSGNSKALYELPWYIIIGPPGSGKTTALVNSSLDFPLAEQFGKGALQGVGGTRNCDWWFTNEAVLIDTAGRYTTQDSHRVIDSSAWEGFLGLLKRNRRRRPVNGAIIAISLQDLLTQSEAERAKHAKIIRSRIDELMEKLEIRFPIYLMFTKSDLVSGFSEFFEDLNKDEREQVWGVSLPNAPESSQSPDFDFLGAELKKLVVRVYDRVLWRVHQERDSRRRGAIQGFPIQMENVKVIAEDFVRQTFVNNRYQLQPYLRGVYFTSGTQDGTPIDRLMTSVSANFGFPREASQPSHPQGKSFFLGTLFREVIFPESELVGSSRKYETMVWWGQRLAYVALAVFTVATLIVWAGSVTRHKMFMTEVESYIGEYREASKRINAWSRDLKSVLPSLNALGKASIVYDQEEHPWLSGMGLYDSNVDIAADKAYEYKLKTLLLPKLLHNLEAYIKQGHKGGDLYNTFRVYLMFNKTEYMNKELIRDWFKSNWSRQMLGEGGVRNELEAHLNALLDLELEPAELNNKLVAQTRELLLRTPVAQRVYSRIRTNTEYSQAIDMLNEFGESVRQAYKIDTSVKKALNIPLLFTIDGYENIDLSTESPVIADIINERWVLSNDESARVDFIKEDLSDISEKVKVHYYADYISTWNALFAALEIASFNNLQQASNVLAGFTDPVYSPLVSILNVAQANTQLSSPILANLADDHDTGKTGQATGYLANTFDGTKVDKQFRSLNVLLRESSKGPAPFEVVIQEVNKLKAFIEQVSVSPDPSKRAFEVVKARYQSGAPNAITTLRSFAKNTPEPVQRWLVSLADETWKVLLQSAHGHIATEWGVQVYQPYQQGLAGRYPLKRSARQELEIFDFSEFFKPQGTVDKFYLEYIKPFVDSRRGWNNRVVDGSSLGFSSGALAQLRKADSIKKIFFRNNPAVPGLTFQMQPYSMSKSDARFTLELGDKRMTYNHGPKFWKTLSWSGAAEDKRVRIIFEDLNEELHSDTYTGPWAWFRLQDNSNLRKTGKTNVYRVSYKVKEGKGASEKTHEIVYDIKAQSVNNPFGDNLLASFRCPESL